MIIQIILILFILFAITRVVKRYRENILSVFETIMWVLFWVGVGGTVAYPQLTQIVAEFVGVGRGVDLVLYISIVILFYGVFKILVRLDTVERNITKLVREDAIRNGKNHREK